MSINSKISNINACRICLNTNPAKSVSLDDGDGWLEMYRFCFGLTISAEDMPRKLCALCVSKMEDCHKLKNQSINSDRLWKNLITGKPVIITLKQTDIVDECITIKEESYKIDDSSCDENFHDDNISIKSGKVSPKNESLSDEEIPLCVKDDNISIKSRKDSPKSGNESLCDNDNIDDNISIKSEKDLPKKRRKKKLVNEDLESSEKLKNLSNDQDFSYSCRKCKLTFEYRTSYMKHVNKADCDYRSVAPKRYYMNAKLKRQAKVKELYCGLCNKNTTDSADMKEHLNIHGSNNDLSCKLCDYTGRDFADMVKHRFTHQKYTSIRCHSCDKRLGNTISLEYHYRSVHLKKAGGWCPKCNKTINSYKYWLKHIKLHNGENLYICDYCNRKFPFRYEIINHMKCHGFYFSGSVCHICGRKFSRNCNLKLHIERVHDNNEVTCSHCNKVFKNEKYLTAHMQREAREKKYQCEFCPKSFLTPTLLNLHTVWHKDERPFGCDVCESKFKSKHHLKLHMRSHTGDFPFKCPIPNCTRAFSCSNRLKVHVGAHTGNKRYKCEYCEKSFHNKCNVVTHCAKHHNVHNVLGIVPRKAKQALSKIER